MRRAGFKPLIWPVAMLVLGAVVGRLADTAVGRWQDYGLYGLTRPVADLLMIIGAVWLATGVIGVARDWRG